jgi:molybdopterin converting factor small subunit
MAQLTVRLFGLRKNDAGWESHTRTLEPGMTVSALWENLRREAQPGEKLFTIDAKGMLALLNGRALRSLTEWDTEVSENDTVTYMPKAFGG